MHESRRVSLFDLEGDVKKIINNFEQDALQNLATWNKLDFHPHNPQGLAYRSRPVNLHQVCTGLSNKVEDILSPGMYRNSHDFHPDHKRSDKAFRFHRPLLHRHEHSFESPKALL
ncbi:hypothetical protein AMTR_s00075p00111240 [Amborella trichopoda]|uniref:Uncharacterized protein n=1 Tax=Amborella trichopoda TaxID=13333 RepID=W1PC25_AMBTC|nr:hypothetical protein AMTR_s00075p00111240 [Amborella trichopoda]